MCVCEREREIPSALTWPDNCKTELSSCHTPLICLVSFDNMNSKLKQPFMHLTLICGSKWDVYQNNSILNMYHEDRYHTNTLTYSWMCNSMFLWYQFKQIDRVQQHICALEMEFFTFPCSNYHRFNNGLSLYQHISLGKGSCHHPHQQAILGSYINGMCYNSLPYWRKQNANWWLLISSRMTNRPTIISIVSVTGSCNVQ